MYCEITVLPAPFKAKAEIEDQHLTFDETSYAVHVVIRDENDDELVFPYVWSVERVRFDVQLFAGVYGPSGLRSYLIRTFGERGLDLLNDIRGEINEFLSDRYDPYDDFAE